jgi:Ca-activated chloride channel family protein
MLNFDWPWLFTLLPLPLLAYFLLPRAKQQDAALRVPFFQQLTQTENPERAQNQSKKPALIISAACWLCLIIAAASPVWIGEPIALPSSGRDLMLAVDISGSMEREDMILNNQPVNRLSAVKSVLNEFIQRRQGDRLGLVLFADKAYLQSPLTFDISTVKTFLQEAQLGFAGTKATAIGDAIGLTVKRLHQRPGKRHVVILLTDGANTGGSVEPLEAAKLAAENDITIYTVGVGADSMVTQGLFGTSFGSRRINPSADLDEASLNQIAELTGGRYFRARDPQELSAIYQLLDELEPVEDKPLTFRPSKALFYWPLAIALILSGLFAAMQLWQQHRRSK